MSKTFFVSERLQPVDIDTCATGQPLLCPATWINFCLPDDWPLQHQYWTERAILCEPWQYLIRHIWYCLTYLNLSPPPHTWRRDMYKDKRPTNRLELASAIKSVNGITRFLGIETGMRAPLLLNTRGRLWSRGMSSTGKSFSISFQYSSCFFFWPWSYNSRRVYIVQST